MKNLTRVFAALLCLLLSALPLCGCAGNGSENGGSKVITTVFAAYDWAKNLLKGVDGAEVTLLTATGVDIHSYNPSAEDILSIKNCAVFVFVGGESDKWTREVLPGSGGPVKVELFEVPGVKLLTDGDEEGMTASGEEEEPDEHIWLSLGNAAACCDGLEKALCEAFPQHSEQIKTNAAEYKKALLALKEKFISLRENSRYGAILIADRYPFRYLADEAGITCYAAFRGCSSEANASVQTITFLSGKLASLSLPAVLILEHSDPKLARTVIDTAQPGYECAILTLDSMQSVTAEDIQNGATYISICEKNLQTLKTALGCGENQ